MYKFDNNSPLYMQLYKQLKNDIESKLQAGAKLPSIRKLSNEYNLSKTTVQNAYNQLYAEGYIESKKNIGYFICEDIIQNFQVNLNEKKFNKEKSNNYKIDFFPASLDKNSFPKKTWLKLYNKALKNDINYGIYHDIQGEVELREELAKYLLASRNVICKSEQIILTSGFTDSLFLLSTILKKFTEKIAIESPSYKTARKVFELANFKIEDILINQNGLDLSLLQRISSKALYLTPSHQFPTGVTIPISNRIKILNWAKENDVFILEDDYDSELSYYNRPIPSMQGLDSFGNVIYLGTFSKALSPALRISYIVLPTKLLEIYKKTFDFIFSQVSIDIQKTLTLFLKDGHWERHLRKIRNINRKKHNLMKESLKKILCDDVKILREGSGLNLLIKPLIDINLEKLEKIAQQKNVKIYFKEFFNLEKVIALGFGGFEEFEIENAIKTFSEIWIEAKNN
ncbi:HTH-type transcriptional regulatory protein GabR [Aliarcobacter thereius]|uniref:HTH-type transcriptional regulatory protein GabR n=1 Tax=Aliarcobacter thereius TaxID=544718 RepID=A0A1C0B6E3_9BACT|nr:PLP-dependent aminotransferase family protein [Aliarcobacter thereius]OCL98879.1 HTH-type transcriptional regulatory protein GabR [Aliarcobacter thereius]HJE03927.1 PLP-dependent aminotransferase family protein [Aliarcobacter thereius]